MTAHDFNDEIEQDEDETPNAVRELWATMGEPTPVMVVKTNWHPQSNARSALIDIAYDCPTLEAAQRRAKEGLK